MPPCKSRTFIPHAGVSAEYLNGYAPRDEEESRIYGIKRGLDFIADRDNKITEKNLRTLYQMTVGDFLDDEDKLQGGEASTVTIRYLLWEVRKRGKALRHRSYQRLWRG